MAGQADSAPTLDNIASFLVDNPEADHDGESALDDAPAPRADKAPAVRKPAQVAAPDPDEDPDADPDGLDDPDALDAPDADDPDAEPEEPDASQDTRHKVTIKGADGAEETLEVPTKELIAGYMRHSNYTAKAQELSQQKQQAFEIVSTKVNEAVEVAERAHTAIVRLAGLKTSEEMAALAATDRGAYVEEKARQEYVLGVLQQIEGEANRVKAEGKQLMQQRAIEARDAAWVKLESEGVKREHLVPLFTKISKAYGVPNERFKNITDPALVLIMRDAAAYRDLKSKTAGQAKQRLAAAPPVPKARQQAPRQAKVNRQLDGKFSARQAGVRDLGAWIANNSR